MYSRYPNYRFSGGVRVPDNYSGNAFKPTPPEGESESATESESVAEAAVAESVAVSATESASTDSREDTAAVFKPEKGKVKFPSFNFNLGKIFSGGFGFEELLIIGLILLIAQNGTDDDIILLLALLLFIG
ncbi:MAG: hypothetical protein J6A83_08110 [Clostridia bacterium]|nr:hypothetical protein [Clostridia bacterium]